MILQIRNGVFETNSSSTHAMALSTRDTYIDELLKDISEVIRERIVKETDYSKYDWDKSEDDTTFYLDGYNLLSSYDEDIFTGEIILSDYKMVQLAFTIMFTYIKDYKIVNFERYAYFSTPFNNGKIKQYQWFVSVLQTWLNVKHPGYNSVALGHVYNGCCYGGYSYNNEMPEFSYEKEIYNEPLYKFFFGSKETWENEEQFKECLSNALNQMDNIVFLNKYIPYHWYNKIEIEKH